jgi:hypothetical protein
MLLAAAMLGGFLTPANGLATDGCNSTTAFCYANPKNHIASKTGIDLGACCALCHATPKCASFSHWCRGCANATESANCFLFSTVAGANPHVGDCASGTSGRAPSPAPAPAPPPHGPPSPPLTPSGTNFLLYVPGSVRADSLGTYGHPVAKSPAFDRLAAQGTLFEQAHAVSPSTSPSRIAMATGRYVHTKNHRTAQHLVQTWESNLFGLLHDQGYYVAFFGKNYMLSADSLQKVDFWAPEASAANDTAMLEFLANPPKQPFVMLVSPPNANYEGDPESGGAPPAFGEPGYYSYHLTRHKYPDRNPDLTENSGMRASGLLNYDVE